MEPCELIRDLLPLYVDDCCSTASRRAVEDHLAHCSTCRKELESLQTPLPLQTAAAPPEMPESCPPVQLWKASILQSLLFLFTFALIVLGVAKEAASSFADPQQGLWFFDLVAPATSFLFSLLNGYFLRLYPSARRFSACSALLCLLLSFGAWGWGIFHYGHGLPSWIGYLPGLLLTLLLCIASALFSALYARMLGKGSAMGRRTGLALLLTLLLIPALVGYGIYWGFYDLQHLSGQELLETLPSPDGHYTVSIYRNNGGATSGYALLGTVINQESGRERNFYWQYQQNLASFRWIDEYTVEINGILLDVRQDSYDYRKRANSTP